MPEITIVYWRDIPAQVIVGKGRRAAKVQLAERFEKAIDRCAMKTGAGDTDAYLAEWRKSEPRSLNGDARGLARLEADRLEREIDDARLKQLVNDGGYADRDSGIKAGIPET